MVSVVEGFILIYSLLWSREGCLFKGKLSLCIGDRWSVRFWRDPWVDSKMRLKDRCPSLFRLSSLKQGRASEFFSVSKGYRVFKWENFPNMFEIMEFLDLRSCICMFKLNPDVKNSWKWQGSPNGSFETKDMYLSMVAIDLNEEFVDFPWLKLWWKAIPSKVSAFAWK